MKTLYESLLDDEQDLMNRYDLGAAIPKVIQLLDDPLSVHYYLYSPNNFSTGFTVSKNEISYIKRKDFLKYKDKHHKTATDIWAEKGQPGWEALWKLADKSLKKAEVRKGDYGEYIKFSRPSQSNKFHKAKVISINVVIYNKKVKMFPYLIIKFKMDKTNSFVQLDTMRYNNVDTNSGMMWDVDIYDINSNPTWMGLVDEIIKHFDPQMEAFIKQYRKK